MAVEVTPAMSAYEWRTRPMLARRAWYTATCYIIGFELLHGLGRLSVGANFEFATVILSPAIAYLGLRSWDKHQETKLAIAEQGSEAK